jgi:hypothetical protein
MATVDYGIQLKRGNGASPEVFTAIASVVNLAPPEIMNPAFESTAHDTGGYRTFQSTMLREVGEFTITINYTPSTAQYGATTGLLADVVAGTAKNYQIVFPDSTIWAFSAIATSFAPSAPDATGPDGLKADVTFRPTGTPTLA